MSGGGFLDEVIDRWRGLPDVVAVEGPADEVLTGRDLLHRVGSTAAALHADGHGIGTVVASVAGRTIDSVVLWLASFRVGAAWFPIDPTLPRPEVEALCARAGARMYDTTATPPVAGAPPTPEADPARLAWIVATSGSTGPPRLVEVLHRGYLPMLREQVDAFGIRSGDRVLSALSTGFDATLSDWGTALLAGATLVLAPSSVLRNRDELLGFLHHRRVTHADLPPPVVALLDPTKLPPTLRTIVVGGEPSDPRTLSRLARTVRVVNVYGPSEATVCCALEVVDPDSWDTPLVGRPLAGTELRVASSSAVGEEGELLVGGPLLARGYRGDDEESARSFITRGGERWFRTGDRVRGRGDGSIEFLGRVGAPLKLSGRRVSTSDVELRLKQLPGVREAVACAVPLPSGRFVLGACVASDDDAVSLRESAARALPASLVPSRWLVLESLPRDARLKLDREAASRMLAAPADAGLDDVLADAWHAVLGRRPANGSDRFDLLGGDSLALLELAHRLGILGIDADPTTLAAHPTFEAQSRAIRCDAVKSGEDEGRSMSRRRKVGRSGVRRTGVLVTGATGRVGRALVFRLAGETSRPLVAVARRSRDASWPSGVRSLTLDVGAFDPDEVARSCADVGEIVHLAAEVSGGAPGEVLARTNVDGTRNVIGLAALLGARLHHVSTLSVFTHAARVPSRIDERTPAPDVESLDSPYARTKRLGEQAVLDDGDVDAVVWRPGLLVPVGDEAADDHLSRVIRGLARVGVVPDDQLDGRFDVTPQARLVESIAASLDRTDLPPVLHVAGSRTYALEELVEVLRRVGVPLTPVPRATWDALVARDADVLVAQASLSRRARGLRLLEASGTTFDTSTLDALFPPAHAPAMDPLERIVIQALGALP